MAKPLLLIDGDILIYMAVAAVEKELEFQEDMWVLFSDLHDAQNHFKDALAAITDAAPNHEPYLCVTGFGNFRKELDPTYKAHRKKTRLPTGFKAFKQWVTENYPHMSKPGIEADDSIGILATKPGNHESLIWSTDKDMMQIPGNHLIEGKVVIQSEAQADYVHMMQTLTGDPADGYKGCPGMGAVKATKALHPFWIDGKLDRAGAWGAVLFAYESAGLEPSDALLQARLARILRWKDWDGKKQTHKLWEPPQA